MSDLRKAAQQALDNAELMHDEHVVRYYDDINDEQVVLRRTDIDTLRAALAQPEPEPDESVIFYRCKGCASAYESDCPASCDCMTKAGFLKVKYFTHQSKHRPLTDEEMKRVCVEAWSFDPYEIARAIEKAHGIGGEV